MNSETCLPASIFSDGIKGMCLCRHRLSYSHTLSALPNLFTPLPSPESFFRFILLPCRSSRPLLRKGVSGYICASDCVRVLISVCACVKDVCVCGVWGSFTSVILNQVKPKAARFKGAFVYSLVFLSFSFWLCYFSCHRF